MDETKRFLDSTHGIRNDASYGMFIGEERFNGFFHEYRHFHEHLLPDILRLKQRMKSAAKDDCAGCSTTAICPTSSAGGSCRADWTCI